MGYLAAGVVDREALYAELPHRAGEAQRPRGERRVLYYKLCGVAFIRFLYGRDHALLLQKVVFEDRIGAVVEADLGAEEEPGLDVHEGAPAAPVDYRAPVRQLVQDPLQELSRQELLLEEGGVAGGHGDGSRGCPRERGKAGRPTA